MKFSVTDVHSPIARAIVFICVSVFAGCGPGPVAPHVVRGVWHKIGSGESIESIALQYKAEVNEIAELNDLPSGRVLASQNEIFIPLNSGKQPGTGAPPSPSLGNTEGGEQVPAKNKGGLSRGVQGRCSGEKCFVWPVEGEVSSLFGVRDGSHHDGLDIRASEGSSVLAVSDGTVLYSGDEIKGYGNMIIVRHNSGEITVYAHNSKNLVREGKEVERGEKIALVGRSGSATSSHLHFEVRLKEKPVDPLQYLPSRK